MGSALNRGLYARSTSTAPANAARLPPDPVSSSQNPSSVRFIVRCRSRSAVALVRDRRSSVPSSPTTSRYEAVNSPSESARTIRPRARNPLPGCRSSRTPSSP